MMRYLLIVLTILPFSLFAQEECDVTISTTPISCAGEDDGTATVETLSGGPFVYSWDGGAPGPDATITDLPAGIYTVLVLDTVAMCVSELVVILEDPGIMAMGNIVYCPSDAPVLIGTPIGGYEPLYYAWSTGDTTTTLSFPAGTEGTFTVNSIDANGCEAEFEFELVEMPSPVAVMGIPDTACQNVRVQVLTLATNGDSLVWRWGVDGYSNAYNDLISFTESGYQPISLQAFDTLGCGGLPSLDSIYIDAQVPAIFTATQIPCTPELDILLGSDTDSCAFFFNDQLVTNECNGYLRFNARRYDLHTFTLYATQPNGCNDTLQVTVDLRTEPTLFLANAFSPDGDGINETWPARVDIPPLGYEVAVYDRWGELLWSATDPAAQWDGNVSGGQAPVGVYAYTMKHRDPCEPTNEVSSRGHVTVVR